MKRARGLLLLGGLAFLAAMADTTGTISGFLKDSSGAPVTGAKLVVTSTTKGIKTTSTTNSKGAYAFLTLSAGIYDLHVEASGFKPQNRPGLVVHVNSAIKIDLTLEPADKAGIRKSARAPIAVSLRTH
jgi:hypothetical protein